jgi:molecular chaperone GrpE (heat shock protein)
MEDPTNNLLERYARLVERQQEIIRDLDLKIRNLMEDGQQIDHANEDAIDALSAVIDNLRTRLAEAGVEVTQQDINEMFDSFFDKKNEESAHEQTNPFDDIVWFDSGDEVDPADLPDDLRGFARYDRKWIWKN